MLNTLRKHWHFGNVWLGSRLGNIAYLWLEHGQTLASEGRLSKERT
jgi:hypothetical protein